VPLRLWLLCFTESPKWIQIKGEIMKRNALWVVLLTTFCPLVFGQVETDFDVKLSGPKNAQTATITRYKGKKDGLKNIVVPSVINGVPVNDIDEGVFRNKGLQNQLTSVTIPGNVLTINESAFADNQLTNVELKTGITTIQAYAFLYNKISSVTMPASINYLGSNLFTGGNSTSKNNKNFTKVILECNDVPSIGGAPALDKSAVPCGENRFWRCVCHTFVSRFPMLGELSQHLGS
jgi:hypothetical protein